MGSKGHIVLVHGACHGAWCWFKVAPLLKSKGYSVTIPDLADAGIDPRSLGTEEVATFDDYSKPLLEIMASLPLEEKVILVGHSLGGINIALAADKFPEKVTAVVFVTAFLPDCASSPSSVMKPVGENPQFAWMDTQFSTLRAKEEEKPLTSMLFGPEFLASKLYQLCSQEDLMLASMLLRPSSLFMDDLESAPAFSDDRYGSVPRFYVVCGEDAVIVKDYQHSMIRNHPVKKVFVIERADHMAMLSTPRELFDCLICIADDMDS